MCGISLALGYVEIHSDFNYAVKPSGLFRLVMKMLNKPKYQSATLGGNKMRVIAGRLRGKKLIPPEDYSVRPTLDRVREAVFSMIAFEIPEAEVLDLFGGTGAMAIEALSRGASHAVVVDKERRSIDLIRKNVSICGLEDKTTIFHEDYAFFLTKTHKMGNKFDIIFVDPPYHGEMLATVLKEIDESDILSEDGYVILETDKGVQSAEETERLIRTKEKVYSKSRICIYRRKQI